jgi:putative sigma-54 modulation protein
MEIRIESPHFTASEHINEIIADKVSKLEHFNERLIRAEVFLKMDKDKKEKNCICEIKVEGPGKSIFAKKRAISFEIAIVDAIHALERQLRKKKTQWEKRGTEKLDLEEEESEVD